MAEESPDKTEVETATTIYREVCNNIRTTDEVSFRLLGLVPLVTAAGIFGIIYKPEFVSSPLAVVITIFAAIVTSALFCWELRNLRLCSSYIEYAKILEKYVFYSAMGKLAEKEPLNKSTLKERTRGQGLFSSRPDTKVIRKTIAECIIYSATISAWITISVISLIT